jgi:enoyl-CoA hydratase/carnithine racemase
LIRTRHSPARLLASLGDRVTAYLHGACMGSGIELPAFAHSVVASADTVVRLPELEMGLIPGAGGTVSLARRVGRARTGWLVWSGQAIDAGTAQAWGLVDQLAEPTP